jgi:histidinol dehydrogenase
MRFLDTQVDPPEAIRAALTQASILDQVEAEQAARAIVAEVRAGGDAAVRACHHRFDGADLGELEVPGGAWQAACASLDARDREALEAARAAIEAFHRQQPGGSWQVERDGSCLGQRVRPLARVGIVVPAGRAPLPSTLLMAAVPARVAGVKELVVCSAPRRDGSVDPAMLAAAAVAGVDRFFRIGGAQAVAALAYGTETVPKVDKIVGPGNIYTVMAKRSVFGAVAIESLPGPTEIVVIADDSADARWVAADLLSQAEHGEDSLAILLTPDRTVAGTVVAEVERQLADLPRHEIAGACLRHRGWAILTRDLEEACALADFCAPEHLELAVHAPETWAERIENAGAIFLGDYAAEAIGDYLAGPSHILPTGGTARFASPLNVDDFLKKTSILSYTPERFRRDAPHVARLARLEGLEGHARAVEIRLQNGRVGEWANGGTGDAAEANS